MMALIYFLECEPEIDLGQQLNIIVGEILKSEKVWFYHLVSDSGLLVSK